jgi:Ca-activated chloride channel family protein
VRAPTTKTTVRKPLNLAVVLDGSGSMNEDAKIGYLRQAMHLLADQLLPTDHLAIVAFSTESRVLVPSHPVIHREYLHHRIEELVADGWTNLSAGMLDGYGQTQAERRAAGTNGHVLLLTDGQANRGVTNPDRLAKLAASKRSEGLSLSTIGLGAKFDEKVLSHLAAAGGGRYVYIRTPEEIPNAIRRELGSLVQLAAQNVRVQIAVPNGGRVDHIYGTVVEERRENTDTIPLGDMSVSDEKSFLVVLRFAPQEPLRRLEIRCSLVYDDAASGRRKGLSRTATINVSSTQEKPDETVTTYAKLVLGLENIHHAVEGRDDALARKSIEMLEHEYPKLKDLALASGDQDLVNKAFLFHHFATELDEVIEAGLLHEHGEELEHFEKDLHYRRYLLRHHRKDKH